MAETPPPTEGERLGPYRLLRMIGEGGMARIYLAEHEKLGRMVAIKRLHRSHFEDKVIVARFLAEARAVADIAHPNLIAVHDVVDEPNEIYLVMDYYDGRDVADVLRLEGKLSVERAVEVALGVCDGLQAVHERGIIHRDLKPENVFIAYEPDGKQVVKLLDFGVARLTEDRPKELRTRSGLTVGTPTYMSPEQATASKIDGRSDIYAVGVLIYEMLVGKPPFTGGYGDVMLKHVNDAPPSLAMERPGTPKWLEAIVMRCLAKAPDDRFQTAKELADSLRRGDQGAPVKVAPVGRGRRWWWAAAVFVPATAIAALSLMGLKLRPDAPPPPALQVQATSAVAGGPEPPSLPAPLHPIEPPRPAPPPVPSSPVAVSAPARDAGRPAPPRPHALHVVTSPIGARVMLNRELRCQSPCDLVLPSPAAEPTVEVAVSADGYQDDQRTVDAEAPPPEVRFNLRRRGSGSGTRPAPSTDKNQTVDPFR